MKRKVLLLEPNYKNKYPPMGLMKLASYFRLLGDDVTFYKGDLNRLKAKILVDELILELKNKNNDVFWADYYESLIDYIKIGRYDYIDKIIKENPGIKELLNKYRKIYQNKQIPNNYKFDFIAITTLFTFYWDITIKTINFAKQICKDEKCINVGGIAASILPDQIYMETNIHPHVGLLNKPGDIDADNNIIIDELPLDYSILHEIDYKYPTNNAYFAYMTRGCVNRCPFCAVPTLEPIYCDYIGLKNQLDNSSKKFGEKKDLMLLDNNVLASKSFDKIIEEIKNCGFGKGAKYTCVSEYDTVLNNLKSGYNDKAYIRRMIELYKDLNTKLTEKESALLYKNLESQHCLHWYSATKESILELDPIVSELFKKYYKSSMRVRYVDFNQGIDSRLINNDNMKKLSEINIKPLRIAFDHWSLKDVYERSIRLAAKNGIKNLSNYLLYNFRDTPEELYYRMKMNVDLSEELKVTIYSFPMKYHPIKDPEYFRNRDYIGPHWNRKFIRAIQAILNSTKGKIGKGVSFFNEAFGKDINEFYKILWMPEAFIIYRRKYDKNLREKLKNSYSKEINGACDLANEWWHKFNDLSNDDRKEVEKIVSKNNFTNINFDIYNKSITDVLQYYLITR